MSSSPSSMFHDRFASEETPNPIRITITTATEMIDAEAIFYAS